MPLADLMRTLMPETVADIAMDAIPYAQFLGLRVRVENDVLIMHLPFTLDLIGNPQPQRLHGGVIGGMLETTGAFAVARVLAQRSDSLTSVSVPKPITITLDYLRAGAPEDTFACAFITRLGRRVANVRAEAWQSDRTRLIATAHMNMLVG
jgi:acyl-coenzyme A thioesterase PaaI-like protein